MEYIKEEQILLNEELCAESQTETSERLEALRRFRDNIRLANSIAYKIYPPKYCRGAVDKEDIYQLAYTGLWRACLNFDEGKGYQFSTYAVPMIRGVILQGLHDNEIIKVPRSFMNIRNALQTHGFTLPLSNEEVEVILAEKRFSRGQLLKYAEVDTLSLDSPIASDNKTVYLSDFLADPHDLYIEEVELSDSEIEKIIDKVVSYMKPKYRDMIEEWMYATLSGEEITQMELKEKYGISQPHVHRILKLAVSIAEVNREEILDLLGIY